MRGMQQQRINGERLVCVQFMPAKQPPKERGQQHYKEKPKNNKKPTRNNEQTEAVAALEQRDD
jgi:hypothetical protein